MKFILILSGLLFGAVPEEIWPVWGNVVQGYPKPRDSRSSNIEISGYYNNRESTLRSATENLLDTSTSKHERKRRAVKPVAKKPKSTAGLEKDTDDPDGLYRPLEELKGMKPGPGVQDRDHMPVIGQENAGDLRRRKRSRERVRKREISSKSRYYLEAIAKYMDMKIRNKEDNVKSENTSIRINESVRDDRRNHGNAIYRETSTIRNIPDSAVNRDYPLQHVNTKLHEQGSRWKKIKFGRNKHRYTSTKTRVNNERSLNTSPENNDNMNSGNDEDEIKHRNIRDFDSQDGINAIPDPINSNQWRGTRKIINKPKEETRSVELNITHTDKSKTKTGHVHASDRKKRESSEVTITSTKHHTTHIEHGSKSAADKHYKKVISTDNRDDDWLKNELMMIEMESRALKHKAAQLHHKLKKANVNLKQSDSQNTALTLHERPDASNIPHTKHDITETYSKTHKRVENEGKEPWSKTISTHHIEHKIEQTHDHDVEHSKFAKHEGIDDVVFRLEKDLLDLKSKLMSKLGKEKHSRTRRSVRYGHNSNSDHLETARYYKRNIVHTSHKRAHYKRNVIDAASRIALYKRYIDKAQNTARYKKNVVDNNNIYYSDFNILKLIYGHYRPSHQVTTKGSLMNMHRSRQEVKKFKNRSNRIKNKYSWRFMAKDDHGSKPLTAVRNELYSGVFDSNNPPSDKTRFNQGQILYKSTIPTAYEAHLSRGQVILKNNLPTVSQVYFYRGQGPLKITVQTTDQPYLGNGHDPVKINVPTTDQFYLGRDQEPVKINVPTADQIYLTNYQTFIESNVPKDDQLNLDRGQVPFKNNAPASDQMYHNHGQAKFKSSVLSAGRVHVNRGQNKNLIVKLDWSTKKTNDLPLIELASNNIVIYVPTVATFLRRHALNRLQGETIISFGAPSFPVDITKIPAHWRDHRFKLFQETFSNQLLRNGIKQIPNFFNIIKRKSNSPKNKTAVTPKPYQTLLKIITDSDYSTSTFVISGRARARTLTSNINSVDPQIYQQAHTYHKNKPIEIIEASIQKTDSYNFPARRDTSVQFLDKLLNKQQPPYKFSQRDTVSDITNSVGTLHALTKSKIQNIKHENISEGNNTIADISVSVQLSTESPLKHKILVSEQPSTESPLKHEMSVPKQLSTESPLKHKILVSEQPSTESPLQHKMSAPKQLSTESLLKNQIYSFDLGSVSKDTNSDQDKSISTTSKDRVPGTKINNHNVLLQQNWKYRTHSNRLISSLRRYIRSQISLNKALQTYNTKKHTSTNNPQVSNETKGFLDTNQIKQGVHTTFWDFVRDLADVLNTWTHNTSQLQGPRYETELPITGKIDSNLKNFDMTNVNLPLDMTNTKLSKLDRTRRKRRSMSTFRQDPETAEEISMKEELIELFDKFPISETEKKLNEKLLQAKQAEFLSTDIGVYILEENKKNERAALDHDNTQDEFYPSGVLNRQKRSLHHDAPKTWFGKLAMPSSVDHIHGKIEPEEVKQLAHKSKEASVKIPWSAIEKQVEEIRKHNRVLISNSRESGSVNGIIKRYKIVSQSPNQMNHTHAKGKIFPATFTTSSDSASVSGIHHLYTRVMPDLEAVTGHRINGNSDNLKHTDNKYDNKKIKFLAGNKNYRNIQYPGSDKYENKKMKFPSHVVFHHNANSQPRFRRDAPDENDQFDENDQLSEHDLQSLDHNFGPRPQISEESYRSEISKALNRSTVSENDVIVIGNRTITSSSRSHNMSAINVGHGGEIVYDYGEESVNVPAPTVTGIEVEDIPDTEDKDVARRVDESATETKTSTGIKVYVNGHEVQPENDIGLIEKDEEKKPEDYKYTWSEWSECSVSCGLGQRFRTNRCENNLPCTGQRASTETEVCSMQDAC